MSFRRWVPASNDENVTGARSTASDERWKVASALQRCLAAAPASAQRGDAIPLGVRNVSWTGEHNGDRVRHRSSGFHRRDFVFGALATVATRVKFAWFQVGSMFPVGSDLWAYQRDVTLDFSRPGKPADNAFMGRGFHANCDQLPPANLGLMKLVSMIG
jgi:hypothetical protein